MLPRDIKGDHPLGVTSDASDVGRKGEVERKGERENGENPENGDAEK